MGTVKKKLPTPDKNPVDGDKLIEATKPKTFKESINPIPTKPKKVKEEEPKPDVFKLIGEDINFVFRELNMMNDWIADLETKLNKVLRRLGL